MGMNSHALGSPHCARRLQSPASSAYQDGVHHMQGDRPFGIRVAAFDDFVSYAFTGSLDLRKP